MLGLDLQVVEKRFPQATRAAIAGLELHVAPGEFLALVGPSGCGKSTLLAIVAGLDRDFEGRIAFRLGERHVSTPRLGFIFQEPRLMPWLTTLQNLTLVLGEQPDAVEQARAALEAVGLADWEQAYPSQLSGGMQRRVALARAYCVNPEVLLLDEPFVSLDAPTADALRALVAELWEARRPTVVFVTHSLREALALADRVQFLSAGPARAILDLPVALPRPRRLEDPQVSALQQRLLADHPTLLEGRIDRIRTASELDQAPVGKRTVL